MHDSHPLRRSFLTKVTRFAAACIAGFPANGKAQRALPVPWSAGTGGPRAKAPPNSTDCHHHIYDSRFPVDSSAKLRPGNATVADYRLLQQRLGTQRNVVIQPSTYGVDNRCLVDALHQFGVAATRGIAVVDPNVSHEALRNLHAAGVCGIRFNVVQSDVTTLDMVGHLAKRIAALGWHVQINAPPEQILARTALWKHLPVPVVFDHLGHVLTSDEPAFGVIADLLQRGRCWVKLSGLYIDSKAGPPNYVDRAAVTKAYLKEAPDRLIWGTDWPHPTATDTPDDALLFDLFQHWASNPSLWTKVLVQNPTVLYGFS